MNLIDEKESDIVKHEPVRNVFFRIREIYVITYFIYLTALQIVPVRLFFDQVGIGSILYSGFILVGAILLLVNFVFGRAGLKERAYIFPVLFLIAGLLSSIVHYQYDFFSNIKLLCCMAIQFSCFYMLKPKWSGKNPREIANILLQLFLALWTIAAIVSLGEFVIGYGCQLDDSYGDLSGRRLGFIDQRLFGVFGDINYAATGSNIVLLGSIFFFLKNRGKKFPQCYYFFCALFNWIFIVLSGSRTALLTLLVSAFIISFFLIWKQIVLKRKQKALQFFAPILLSVAFVGLIYGAYVTTEKVSSYVPVAYERLVESDSGVKGDNDRKVNLKRSDVYNSDNISNNRFEIWKDCISVWKTTPIVGATPRGFLGYAQEKFDPNLYIIQVDYESMHSGYISILAFSGIIGAVVSLAWIAFLFTTVLRYLLKKENMTDCNYNQVVFAFSGILIGLVSSMTLTTMFYSILATDAVFWLLCGLTLYLTKKENNPELLQMKV